MRKSPMIRQASVLGTVPMFAVLALSIAGGIYLFPKGGSLLGAALFLLLRLSLWSIPGDHRAGIYLVRKQQFEDAIPHFLRSFEFFQRRLWLDKYRAILMLSTTAISYREMALVNAAFCYSQIGDGENARKYYEQCLGLFPDSVLALSALRMMQAAVSVHQDTYDNESDRTKP